jgi:hypothetical protein
MPNKIAVVSDAVSPDFIFRYWHRYYSGLFGAKNIFIITYNGLSPLFRDFEFGGIIELPTAYDDQLRRDVIGRFVSTLLPCYETVIRVDTDEFLVVDPRVSPSLREFIENNMDVPYLTARGFDVIQLLDEPALPEVPDFPILRDRAFAYPNTALNKTCIVKTDMVWSSGFHWASVFPKFGPLFMLHLKRLDIGWQVNWFSRMSDNIKDNPTAPNSLKDYYKPDQQKIIDYHKGVYNRQKLSGIECWYRDQLVTDYIEKIKLVQNTDKLGHKIRIYSGQYGHEHVLCEIPTEWKNLI